MRRLGRWPEGQIGQPFTPGSVGHPVVEAALVAFITEYKKAAKAVSF